MRVLSVDLAAKFSAAMVVDHVGEVHWQGDSRGLSAIAWVERIKDAADEFAPDLIMVEDVPYGITQQGQIKPILRLQGILIGRFAAWLDCLLFVNPSTWQRSYPGVAYKRGETDEDRILAARERALELDYRAPDLVAEHIRQCEREGTKVLIKNTRPLGKTMTDYVDARLIADWTHKNFDGLRSLPGVQPVFI